MSALSPLFVTQQVLSDTEAVGLVGVLGPLVETRPESDLAQLLRRRLSTVPAGSVAGAVLDWWIKIHTGDVANGACYQLQTLLRGDLEEPMTALRDVHASATPARWLEAKRAFDASQEDLGSQAEGRLTLDYYGKSRLPAERHVWEEVLELFAANIEALRNGRPGPEVPDVEDEIVRILGRTNIVENSRRWDEMIDRVQQVADHLYDVREEALIWVSCPADVEIALVETVPEEVRSELGEVVDLVLRPVLADPPDQPTPARVAARIDAELGDLSTSERNRLAVLIRPWVEAQRHGAFGSGPAVPAIDEALRQVPAIEQSTRELRAAGVDTDDIELHFLEGEFLEALDLIARQQDDKEHELAVNRWRAEVDEAIERGQRVQFADEGLLALRTELGSPGGPGDEKRVRAVLRAANEALERHVAAERREKMQGHIRSLTDLGAPAEQVYDLTAQLDQVITRSRLEDLAGQVADLRARRLEDSDRARERVDAALADASMDAARHEELRQSTPSRPGPGATDSEIMQVRAALAALETEIGKVSRRRWSPGRSSEVELLDHVVAYCTQRVDYHENDLRRLYVALKTKPFVILAGLTGSGKSSIARMIAESLGSTQANGRFRRVAVRPDWIDQSDVLGYINPSSRRFEPGWLADVVRSCQANPTEMFFVLLDEMNLAPVEQYLAEYLSALESARAGFDDVMIPLYTSGASPKNAGLWPAELRFPPNLFVIGTVNVDETTRPLSDRVLDRANLLQLTLRWSRHHHEPESTATLQPWVVDLDGWQSLVAETPADTFHDILVGLAQMLEGAGIGVGLRTHVELERFLANAEDILDPHVALDMGILQRIIPKIRGFKRELVVALEDVREALVAHDCAQSLAVVDRWLDPSVSDDAYIDGTAPHIGIPR